MFTRLRSVRNDESKKRGAERRSAPPIPYVLLARLALHHHLGEVELVERVDVERVLDRELLEVRERVPVDRQDRQRTVLPEQLLLELRVDLVPGRIVRRLPSLCDEVIE